jgi:hypothetical protein
MKPVFLKALIIAAVISIACTTKVSEWVLVNSIADKYRLVYYHKGNIGDEATVQNRKIENWTGTTNIIFSKSVNETVNKPYYALYYGDRLFARYEDYSSISDITSSPLREMVVEELMAGKLCVMLYLKSGNNEKDDQGIQLIKKTLAASPFKDIITFAELERSSITEKHLVSMLLNVESDLKEIYEPMLFGIFGRFRALEPLLGRGITEENINLLIDFLTADCSCLIKDNLPGISILCKTAWERPAPAMVNAILDANPYLLHK